ncbi:hypothetical protein [Candidatus Finniella inopinata]|uniref:Uncharacterized protein n=1 Tax=Candidatus Finniella inopinata TaxID=1696036 RepID=A0A4Q7DKR4_9PROT|nr:hypothetical protein [Candidatus Finniella inopinata]RZI46805.1 hypothetical protein EQU50_00845 [Candidatus Finniella inopinata]
MTSYLYQIRAILRDFSEYCEINVIANAGIRNLTLKEKTSTSYLIQENNTWMAQTFARTLSDDWKE